MDKDKIKKALDHFENDDYVEAKEILKKEISAKRDSFVKDKLELKNDINPAPETKKDDKVDDKGDDKGEE